MITEAGVYDIPQDEYLADPVTGGSLSSTGARALLPPSCPAKFRWAQDHLEETTDAFDLGTAAHRTALGVGPEIAVIPFDKWTTNEAKAQVADARERGAIPIKPAVWDVITAMVASLRDHDLAMRLLGDGADGAPEQTLVWHDRVWRRARIDFLPHGDTGRVIVPDYKTTTDASREGIQRSIMKYRYHQQGAWYLDGVAAMGHDDPAFVLVFQETKPPYLVTVAEMPPTTLRIARALNAKAVEVYEVCRNANRWPGYSDDVELIGLPEYLENRYLQELL